MVPISLLTSERYNTSVLQRHSHLPNTPPYTIASLSPSDGVRLENSHKGHHNTYVNGVYDVDNIQSTSLTILLSDMLYDDVTYGCTIAYTNRRGELLTIMRTLNITSLDIQNMYRVDTTAVDDHPIEEKTAVASSAKSPDSKPYWNTPMILLITMASLLFILFIVCLLLVIDRCKENRRQRRRAEKTARKKSTSKEIKCIDQESRPLPPPPDWTYPPGTAVPPYKSPYHRLKVGAGVRSFADDTGYDSDASMIYCRPYDDVGEVIVEKTALETFGKHLSPMYTHDHLMGNKS